MTRCYEPEEIGAVLDLPADDPARRHLDTCPRCRNLALAYYQYVEGKDVNGEDMGTVRPDADLQRRLALAFAARNAGNGNGNGARTTRPGGTPWVLWLSAAVALAALVILLITGNAVRDGRHGAAGRGALRGEDPNAGLVAVTGPDGLRLTWRTGRRASTYVIAFYDQDMRRIGWTEVLGGSLQMAPDDPLAAAPYCRMMRVVDGDTVSRSELVAPAPAKE